MASQDRAAPRTSPSGDRRRRAGETLVVLGAACLLVATFLPWYGVEGGPVRRFELGATGALPPTGDAWRVLTTVRFLLFALIIAAWIPAALAVADQRAAVGPASLGVALLGAVTGVVLLGRVVDQPGRDRDV